MTPPAGNSPRYRGRGKGLAADLASARLAGYATPRRRRGRGSAHRRERLHRVAWSRSSIRSRGISQSSSRWRVGRSRRAASRRGFGARADGYAHHLLDPSTGRPAWTGVIQATAIADTALRAEALAKAALLSGPERGRELLAAHGGDRDPRRRHGRGRGVAAAGGSGGGGTNTADRYTDPTQHFFWLASRAARHRRAGPDLALGGVRPGAVGAHLARGPASPPASATCTRRSRSPPWSRSRRTACCCSATAICGPASPESRSPSRCAAARMDRPGDHRRLARRDPGPELLRPQVDRTTGVWRWMHRWTLSGLPARDRAHPWLRDRRACPLAAGDPRCHGLPDRVRRDVSLPALRQ